MPTNQEVLDAGLPPLPDPIPSDGSLDPDIERYGNARIAVEGSADSPTDWGTFLRRIPQPILAQTVSFNQHATSIPGMVVDITATAGASLGGKRTTTSRSPDPGEVRVTYQADGTALLLFDAADAVTQCAYKVLEMPAALLAALDAMAEPA